MIDSYNCIFHYNEHTGHWYCIDRNDYRDYWNDKQVIKVGIGSTAEDAFTHYKGKQLN
jgi:hypothetical protein